MLDWFAFWLALIHFNVMRMFIMIYNKDKIVMQVY